LRFTDASQVVDKSDSGLLSLPDTTAAWFQNLAKRGARRLLLCVARGTRDGGLPEVDAVSFAGRGRWIIQADFENEFELWVPNWFSTGLKDKVWSVSYRRHTLKKPIVKPPDSLDSYERHLTEAIRDNWDFASKALSEGKGPADGLSFFAKMFEKALGFTNSNDPKPSYPDMLPETGYGLRSRRLIGTASNAWVFGGMSWWNDIYFDDKSFEKKHSMLVDQLYSAVIEALVAGTNSFEA